MIILSDNSNILRFYNVPPNTSYVFSSFINLNFIQISQVVIYDGNSIVYLDFVEGNKIKIKKKF
jgi:hypothetical protein